MTGLLPNRIAPSNFQQALSLTPSSCEPLQAILGGQIVDGHHLLSLRRFFGSNVDKICASGARGFQMAQPTRKSNTKPNPKSNQKFPPKVESKVGPAPDPLLHQLAWKHQNQSETEPEFEPEVVQEEPEAEPKFGRITVEPETKPEL